MKTIYKNLITGIIVIVGILIAWLLFWFFGQNKALTLTSVPVKNGNISQQINLTGQVKASQGVDLAFETQGKIVANYVKVGDRIYAGQALVAIDSSLLQAQLNQAQAQLGTLDLNTVENKNLAAIQSLYATALSAAQKSVSTAKDILLTSTDIQYAHFSDSTANNIALANAKEKAITSLLGQPGSGSWTSTAISQLNGGAFGLIQNAINNPSQQNNDIALAATKNALQDVSNMLSAIPIDTTLSPAEKTIVSAEKTSINSEIITTSTNIQTIATQKVNNSANVSSTDLQRTAGQAGIDTIKAQISKTVIRALFSGQVDKDTAVVGAIVSPNSPVITISNNNLEIDTNIPEIDISQTKIGSDANVTLDAYGNNVIFQATIVSIDTAQTTVNNIPVYAARLKFKNIDDRIKSGMTANITVNSENKQNVLIVPNSAIIQKDGADFVIIDKGNNQKEVRKITIGLRDNKNTEITSGLSLNENVFAY